MSNKTDLVVTPNLNKEPKKLRPPEAKKVISITNAGRVFKMDDPVWTFDVWYVTLEELGLASYVNGKWHLGETLNEYACIRKHGQHGFCKKTWDKFKNTYKDQIMETQHRIVEAIKKKVLDMESLATYRFENTDMTMGEIRREHNAILTMFKDNLLGKGRYGK